MYFKTGFVDIKEPQAARPVGTEIGCIKVLTVRNFIGCRIDQGAKVNGFSKDAVLIRNSNPWSLY